MWLDHSSFVPFVREVWVNTEVRRAREGGGGRLKFMEKLKCLKVKLKERNQEVFGGIRVKKEEILKEIEALDRLDMDGLSSNEDHVKKASLLNELEEMFYRVSYISL